MSNSLSVKYNPEARFPQIVGSVDNPELVCMYIASGAFPDNMGMLSTQTSTFKEALFAHMAKTDTIEGMLDTLAKRMQCITEINSQEELLICELTATAAYFAQDYDLVKQTLIRVNPAETSQYLRTLYKALVVNSWSGDKFKAAVYQAHSGAIDTWEHEKLSLNI